MKVLLDRLVGEQRWAEVLDWGERWIALGHTPEPAYRALMYAHAASGDVSASSPPYTRVAQKVLSKELGVEPSDQTQALYERLSKGEIRGYELRQHVSTGEFGSSTRLTTASLGVVAIKVILPEYANQPDFIRRFDAEAQLIAKVELHTSSPYTTTGGSRTVLTSSCAGCVGAVCAFCFARVRWSPAPATRLVDQIARH